jgi:hypothetical protein
MTSHGSLELCGECWRTFLSVLSTSHDLSLLEEGLDERVVGCVHELREVLYCAEKERGGGGYKRVG